MCPEVGLWLIGCFGQDTAPEHKNKKERPIMRLKVIVKWLLPSCVPLLERHHTAGADAEMHLRLYVEVARLASYDRAAPASTA